MSMKNSNDTSWDLTSDLPICITGGGIMGFDVVAVVYMYSVLEDLCCFHIYGSAQCTLKMELESCSKALVHSRVSHFVLSQRIWFFRFCTNNQMLFSIAQSAAEEWDDSEIAVLMNLIECKNYKTLWNISRKTVFSKRFIVFNKTGSVRVT